MNIEKNEEENIKKINRKNIEELGNKIRLIDKDDDKDLEMYCYSNCTEDDVYPLTKCKSVILNGENIVMESFPYTVKYKHDDLDNIEKNIQSNFKKFTFYDSHEGILIRMFYFDEQWILSTNLKINAFNSKWSSKESFGTSFKKALESEVQNNSSLRKNIPQNDQSLLERFQSTLDINKQYMFIVLNNEDNRIVSYVPNRPTLYHVGTIINSEIVMTEDCKIPYPKKHNFINIDELINYVSKIDIYNIQGVVCLSQDKNYKILNSKYIDLYDIRGNEPSIKFRYLQCRMDYNKTDKLLQLYPNMNKVFNEIENILYSIAKVLYSNYVQRYIKKIFVTVSSHDFIILRECHIWHTEDRINNKVNLEKIINILNNQSATYLNTIIRKYNF